MAEQPGLGFAELLPAAGAAGRPPGPGRAVAEPARGRFVAAARGRGPAADVLAAAAVFTASGAAGQDRPAPTITNSRRRTTPAPRLLPHTVQLRTHYCQQDPAGFWVSPDSGQAVRRP